MTTPPKYEDLVLKVAGMERREAALIEDLKSEKILSKTFMGQKETFMKLYDAQRVELRECKAREAALREELEMFVKAQLGISISKPDESSFQTTLRLYRMSKRRAAEFGIPEGENLEADIEALEDYDALQQRLTDAERALKFYAEGDHYSTDDGLNWDSCSGEPSNILWHEEQPWFIEDGSIAKAALKPAAEPHKCIECESQYCHGVCVERGDDDERYKGAEGEGS